MIKIDLQMMKPDLPDRSNHEAVTGSGAPVFFSPQVSDVRRFYFDLNPAPHAKLAVVCGGVEHTTPEYEIHRTTFPFFALEYVVRGGGTVVIGGQSHTLEPGRIFSYGPDVRHDITPDYAATLVKYFVNFAGTGAPQLLRSCGLAPGTVSAVFPPNDLQAAFDELVQCGLRQTAHREQLCVSLLNYIALKITDSRMPVKGPEALAFETYQRCNLYIQQHFRRLQSLEQISAECRVNGAYLCRLFRRFDHHSPYQRLLRLKLNFAADLLQRPGTLVKQVAIQVGFNDPFHFSRAFKAVFGTSPEAFKKLR